MKTQRPMFLNLFQIRFPVTAIVSIGHRVTGVLLFFVVPGLIWALGEATSSPAGFAHVKACFSYPLIKCALWLGLVAMMYHLIAGVRHLIMDYGIGESYRDASASAVWVFVFTAVSAIWTGSLIW